MFSRFERHHGPASEPKPTVTDPYRQVLEREFRQTQSSGAHSFSGYDRQAKYKEVWNVVPIDTPDRLMHGLGKLISDVQNKNTESMTLEPSPYDPYVGIKYCLKNKKKYLKELDEVTRKYLRIHGRLRKKFTEEQKNVVQEVIKEAKEYAPQDSITKDPNWRPGTNHHTGRPYDEYRDSDTGEWVRRSFPEK